MQKNSNRKGLALGAAFALVASLFVAAPAQAAAVDGANIGAYPAAGTTFTGVLVSDFNVYTQLKPGSTSTAFDSANLVYKIEKTAGANMDVIFSASAAVSDLTGETTLSADVSGVIAAGDASGTASAIVSAGGASYLNFFATSTSDVASWSPVTLKVTAWIDNQGGGKNDVVDTDEWRTTFTVTLIQPTAMAATTSVGQPLQGDTSLTVSSVVSGANLANIRGSFALALSTSGAASFSGGVTVLVANALSTSAVALRAGVVSLSPAVNAMSAADSFSAVLRYYDGSPDTIYQGYAVGSVQVKVATGSTITALVATVLKSNNASASAQSVPVRVNQTYTVRVHAATNSVSVSGVAISVALSGQALTNGGKMISVNGGAATSSYPTALALTTGTDGYASFTLATSGFENGNVVNVDASVGNLDAIQLVLTSTTPVYSIVNDYDLYVTAPGAVANITYAVADQFQVASPRTDQRIKVTRGGTGFAYAETVSTVAVVAGAASFAFTPAPATKTGSATVTTVLERFDADLNTWVNGGSAGGTVTVNVTSLADAHSVAPAVSFSASVSYFPNTTSPETVTGSVKNAGAMVVVSGDASALVFRSEAGKATASGTVTVRADASGQYTFDVFSLKAGSFDISINVGGSVTTSKMVVDPVADSAGVAITFDTTQIAAGSTKVITGTLVDVNGNPVNTSGSATILVTYLPTGNAGIPIGVMPTETDKDGKFSFTVMTGLNDNGTAVVTASYFKSGASTAVKDVLTATQAINVGGAAAPASDQKITVGSFKGFVAIYTLNYTGQKLSAKVAGRWLVQENMSRFQRVVRNTGAAIPIKVDLYIDGKFVRTENIVTK